MTDETQDRLEERQKLIDAARVSGTTVLYIGVDDYAELVAALRQSQDIEAAAREVVLSAKTMTPEIANLNRVIAKWTHIGVDPGRPEGDWAAHAPKAEEAPR